MYYSCPSSHKFDIYWCFMARCKKAFRQKGIYTLKYYRSHVEYFLLQHVTDVSSNGYYVVAFYTYIL